MNLNQSTQLHIGRCPDQPILITLGPVTHSALFPRPTVLCPAGKEEPLREKSEKHHSITISKSNKKSLRWQWKEPTQIRHLHIIVWMLGVGPFWVTKEPWVIMTTPSLPVLSGMSSNGFWMI